MQFSEEVEPRETAKKRFTLIFSKHKTLIIPSSAEMLRIGNWEGRSSPNVEIFHSFSEKACFCG